MYTPEEQAEHRQKWVDALKSGKYEQGKDMLRDGDKFCCLGVACDISGLGVWTESTGRDENGKVTQDYAYVVNGRQSWGLLPREVRDWLGLKYSDAGYMHGVRKLLCKANDDGFDFNAIVGIIEGGSLILAK